MPKNSISSNKIRHKLNQVYSGNLGTTALNSGKKVYSNVALQSAQSINEHKNNKVNNNNR